MLSHTQIIIFITAIVSIVAFSSTTIKEQLLFKPVLIQKRNEWYRFFTSGLIHADWEHLLFNMLTLYLFGEGLEAQFNRDNLFGENGAILYSTLYISAFPFSMITSYWKHKQNTRYASLGASGAVSAILFASILLNPTIKIGFFILPPVIPGFVFGPAYLLLSSYLNKKGKDNINHAAHIAGAIYGVIFTLAAAYYFKSQTAVLDNFILQVAAYLR
ncbi:MAG: rhomboid family intramembrane serine protease [Chitinophagaceae bacterium]|nr:rhomboid family intramembrane serine protease [Chitinophagaceae bacterium]